MSESIKFWLGSIMVFALLGGLGYFAFSSIDSGSEYVSQSKLQTLIDENQSLREEIKKLETKLESYEPKLVEQEPIPTSNSQVIEKNTETKTYKYSALISELEALVKDNIQMKLKSRGTRVGTVQNFLNIYNNTSNKIDNDYGESTKKAVAAFQKAVGISATGEAGPATFTKMIEWLKKQG
ncbi:MAG: peptidoglycan-binding protein [Candidatus Paceibacteria bacterium]